MDSDEEYSDYEWDAIDGIEINDTNKAPSFETLTADEIVKLMNQNIEHVNAIVQMPATTTRILLSQTKWEKQHLLDKLTDEISDEFFTKANVLNPFAEPNEDEKDSSDNVDCNICFMEMSQEDIVSVGCGHKSCRDCWRQYLSYKILDDGKADAISCPETKCGIVVEDDTVMRLLTDEKTKQKYQHLMTNSFVEHNHLLRWCPSPGCTFAIKANHLLTYQLKSTCNCGHSFCFNCGEAHHDPIPCKLMDNWKVNSNDVTVDYLTKYTKECPKCNAIIEKNGGCNRMICTKCRHPFCWICHGPMETYEHKCNKYEEDKFNRTNLVRWQHYLKRYSIHKKSLECEAKLKDERIIEIMRDLQMAGKTWNEVQFLVKSVDVLCESRKQLMRTYIFAYYIEEQHQKTIFEANQSDLEMATEALSQYLEQNITEDNVEEMMHKVMNKSSYCEKRQKAMQNHIYDGFENDWWKFTVDSWSRLKKMK